MPKYLTATEFGAAVGRSEQTVWRWVKAGSIETVSVGGAKVFKPTQLAKGRKLAAEKRGRKPVKSVVGNQ